MLLWHMGPPETYTSADWLLFWVFAAGVFMFVVFGLAQGVRDWWNGDLIDQ